LAIRTKFESELEQRLPEITIQGSRVDRLPNITNVAFKGVDAESLLLALDRISASTGSACTSTSIEPSHVLRAMGMPRDLAKSAVRFSFGRGTTFEEVDWSISIVTDTVRSLRELSSGHFI
jgi:cysteine desulfurase